MHTLKDLQTNRLPRAKEIKISENLSCFPEEILQLADTLETLDLSNNRLSTLPVSFAKLTKLKTLFLSNNQFDRLPEVLSECPQLDMIGIRNNGLTHIPEHALPPKTRWLILTDNKIEKLPDSMGELLQLQKLMLAGNRLKSLPESLVNCEALELIRISANQLQSLPDFLLQLPKLSWLAFAGNPFAHKPGFSEADLPSTHWDSVHSQEVIGEGASGVISNASWVEPEKCIGDPNQAIVIKKYKGTLTSDGYSHDELAASIVAGQHPNLIPLVAHINQPAAKGLIMHRLSSDYKTLGAPPNRQSCTRDVFDKEKKLTTEAVFKIALSIADTVAYLHDKHLCHGDLYAHNILANTDSDTLLSDFGAASSNKNLTSYQQHALEKIEVRAFGCLLEDLIDLLGADEEHSVIDQWTDLKNRCLQPSTSDRPGFREIATEIAATFNKTPNSARSVA